VCSPAEKAVVQDTYGEGGVVVLRVAGGCLERMWKLLVCPKRRADAARRQISKRDKNERLLDHHRRPLCLCQKESAVGGKGVWWERR
jgi:hypothetical protein